MHPTMHVPGPMALLHSPQFLFLVVVQKPLHLLMRVLHGLADAVASFASDLLQLRRHFFHDGIDLGLLLRRQIQLLAQMFPHPRGHQTGLVKLDEDVPRVHGEEETAHSSRDKSEENTHD